MDKMIFRTIVSKEETDSFLDKVENYSGVRLPHNYAKNGKIIGVFLHNKLVAGYMLVTNSSFRSLLFVPDEQKKSHDFFSKDKFEMMEINGLWIGPAIKTPAMQFKIWLKLILDIFLARKNYLLLMSNVRNKNIEYLHSFVDPETLYVGSPNLMPGENSHAKIRVAYTTRWKVILSIPKSILELKRRKQRAIRAEKQRELVRV